MAIVVDPNFASNRRFYTCQAHIGSTVQVIAWTIDDAYTEATRVNDPLVGGIPAAGRHSGCRLRFGPDGYLWVATGDAARGKVGDRCWQPERHTQIQGQAGSITGRYLRGDLSIPVPTRRRTTDH